MSDIQVKGKIVVDTGNSAEQIDNVKKKLNEAGAAGKGAGGMFGNLKQSLGGMADGMAQGGKGAGLLNGALNVLRANPVTGIFILLAGLVIALVNHFRKMEAVSDSLTQVWDTLSGMMESFMNAVLTPLIDGFVSLIGWVSEAAIWFADKFSPGLAEAGRQSKQLSKDLDDLEDAEKANQVARARSMRQMAEAREIAADANVPIKERIAALQEAARIEREILTESIENNTKHAQIIIATIANKIGATKEEIATIRQANAAQLESIRLELAQRKNVNLEQLNESIKYIIEAEEQGKALANMERKTQKQITSMRNEELQKRKQAEDEAAKRREEQLKKEKADYDKRNEERLKQEKALQDGIDKILNQYQRSREDREAATAIQKLQLQKRRALDELMMLGANASEIAAARKYWDELISAEEQKQRDEALGRLQESGKKRVEVLTQARQQEAERTRQLAEQEAANEQASFDLRMTLRQQLANAIGGLADLVGRQTKLGKALAVAEIALGTATGFIQGLDIAQKTAKGTGPAAAFAFPIFYATQVAAVLAAAGRAKAALQAVPGGGGSGPSITAPSVSVAAPLTPQAQRTALDSDTINQIGNAARMGVARAYVVSNELNNENERNARIERAARIG